MGFSPGDVRCTFRRSPGGETLVHPRLIRDRSFLPRIDIAIQYFESMLGRQRQDLETEVLVHFFADHKVTRCLVACLGRSYRFRTPGLVEVVGTAGAERLRAAGLDSPRALRSRLYAEANELGFGFVSRAERERVFERIGGAVGLSQAELERLLTLDSPEHAQLYRVGAEPRPVDVQAQYNFGMLWTIIRHTASLELLLEDDSPAALETVGQVCAANQVDLTVALRSGGVGLELRGHQDALGGWGRHGRRLARAVVQILELARDRVVSGRARVELSGRQAELKLGVEQLDILAGSPAPVAGWEAARGWEPLAVRELVNGARAPRGWSVRRQPEAQAWETGVVLPELLVRRGQAGYLVCAVRSPSHGRRLATVSAGTAGGESYCYVGSPAALAPLASAGARTLSLHQPTAEALTGALLELTADQAMPLAERSA